MPFSEFKSKRVVVAGGTSGIGLAIALGFSRYGADVSVIGSTSARIDAAEHELQANSISAYRADVRNSDELNLIFDDTVNVDVLVNAAGVGENPGEWDETVFKNVLDINLTGTMRLCQAAKPKMTGSNCSIVNFASMLSFIAEDGVPAYCASKSGILGLTRSLAHSWGTAGVRVNAIAPGYHKTEMTRSLWSEEGSAAAIKKRTAVNRWGTPEDLVGPTLFLASSLSQYVTGECLVVDGGFLSGSPV